MSVMTTDLTEFSDYGNSRTYTFDGHSALKPNLVIQKRRVPSQGQQVAEDIITVLTGTVDSEGMMLPQRVSLEVKVRRPINGQSTDVDSVLAVFRDIIASDEFTNSVVTQEYLS